MQYTVAVRALCEFTAKAGDLDLRFTPSPTAQEGLAGHQVVTARRSAGYEREVALQGEHGALRVRGRADGWDLARKRLEEIKTHRGDLARQPDNHRALHWAQARIYGWLMCQAHALDGLELALVYYDIDTQRETTFEAWHTAQELQEFFHARCELFLAWATQELAHRERRDAALAAMAFPLPSFRPGQRELAQAVWRGAAGGRCLMAQAPTGIGKTIGTLFPLLKACPSQKLDKVFFLAAKTPGRRLALDTLDVLAKAEPAPGLRVLELTARDKACEHPDKACHGDSCPLARGFYDRLPAARAEAVRAGDMQGAALRETARAHAVCPYYLGQELVRWADVVVGDYNYYFDGSAMLHAMAQQHEWRIGLLVDEAHNLVERGRQMYTAAMDPAAFRAVRRSVPAALKRPLERLRRGWSQLGRDAAQPYVAHDELPEGLQTVLQQAVAAMAEHLALAPQEPGGALADFYFEALAFLRLAETFGEHSVFEVTLRPGVGGRADAVPCIRNIVPAPFLGPRLASAHCSTLFSATLNPPAFYQDTLGLPADAPWVEVPAPFVPEQLQVRVERRISTRWADRSRSVAPIARLIVAQYAAAPGNYLAFFSSFDYLHSVAAAVRELAPQLAMWEQSRAMTEAQRGAFIDRFAPGGVGVGFAVLGGSFGEGIDLPGDRLVGAFVATLGLPQLNPVNEQMRRRLEQAFGAGYDYAYLYPGIRKVVQAAGRVIRTREDRGVLWLIDDRFDQPAIRALLPSWWDVQTGALRGSSDTPGTSDAGVARASSWVPSSK
jgi:DNA excision repair protein ERCC-2